MKTDIRLGTESELKEYFDFSIGVQQQLKEKGSGQYVPSAHYEYHESFSERLAKSEFFVGRASGSLILGFCLAETSSEWWRDLDQESLYFSNLVIRQEYQGRGIGKDVFTFCTQQCISLRKNRLRLDCYAGNEWLCNYYEKMGFVFAKKVEQHIGYFGNLYELKIKQPHAADTDKPRR
jgi:GNAT superfamily N-acetyltransferase